MKRLLILVLLLFWFACEDSFSKLLIELPPEAGEIYDMMEENTWNYPGKDEKDKEIESSYLDELYAKSRLSGYKIFRNAISIERTWNPKYPYQFIDIRNFSSRGKPTINWEIFYVYSIDEKKLKWISEEIYSVKSESLYYGSKWWQGIKYYYHRSILEE